MMARSRRPKPGATQDFNEGIYHRPPLGLSFFKTGVLVLIAILILTYFAYTKELPWSSPGYTATATFRDATTVRETTPVRIAGVNVGEVTKVEADGDNAKVTFTVDSDGLPIHDDARITIRPRLFLGGNYFLDLRPGSPSAPDLPDGGDDPDQPDGDRRPARSGADRPAALRPQEPRRLPRGLRIGPRRQADRRDGRRHGSRGPGPVRRRGAQPELQLRR